MILRSLGKHFGPLSLSFLHSLHCWVKFDHDGAIPFFFFFVFCSNTNAPGSGCILILISSLCLTVSEFARPFWWEGQKHEDARRLKRAGCCWEEECMQEVEPKISRKNVDNR